MLRDLVELVVLTLFIRPRLYWIPAALPWLRLGETIFPKEIPLARLSGMKAGLLRHWRTRLGRVHSSAIGGGRATSAVGFTSGLPPAGHIRTCGCRSVWREPPESGYSLSQARGLGLSVAYPTAINEIPELRGAFDDEQFPSARLIADTLVTLPTHQWVSERDRIAIADCVATAIVAPVAHAA